MKCPHCEYKDGWDGVESKGVDGEEGCFFTMTNQIMMKRTSTGPRYMGIFGCPKCMKIFMER